MSLPHLQTKFPVVSSDFLIWNDWSETEIAPRFCNTSKDSVEWVEEGDDIEFDLVLSASLISRYHAMS
jgi:hypothetical protein